MKSLALLIAALLSVAAITYLLSWTVPHCEDSATKLTLTEIALLAQWTVLGGLLYWLLPRHKALFLILFIFLGYPLMTAIWVISLWPPSIFGFVWKAFYMMFPIGYVISIPLVLVGAFIASFIQRKIQGKPMNPQTFIE